MVDAPAGWHPDPYRRHEMRYFDGTSWSEHVSDGGVQAVDDPTGVPAPPSAVPAAAQVPAMQQQMAQAKKRQIWPWILIGVFVFFGIGIAGCVALVAVSADKVVDEIKDSQRHHAITSEQFAAVQLGVSRPTLVATLGKPPVDTESFLAEVSDVRVRRSCMYYWELGETFGDWYQFCFNGAGKLISKHQY